MTARALMLTVILLALAAAPQALLAAAPLPPALAAILGPQDSLLVVDAAGRRRVQWQAEVPRIPASVLKLLTAQVALAHLGPDYRFKTAFFQDAAGNLYVRGRGDPLLISEIIAEAARDLAPRLAPVADIVLDDGYFARPLTIPGVSDSDNPYDAPNGALCANFNTVAVRRRADGRYASAEPQTPLVPLVVKILQQRPPVNGRLVLTHDGQQATAYFGHLLAQFLTAAGRPPSGAVRIGPVPPSARPVLDFTSPFPLSEAIRRMLEFSNNFTANQILIAAAAKVYGPPGTLDKAVALAETYARQTLGWKDFTLTEGSGISRGNRVSAADLDKVLAAFADHRDLLPNQGRVWRKTGTLSGIQARAGYIEGPDGAAYRFVILINTAGRSAEPVLSALLRLLPS